MTKSGGHYSGTKPLTVNYTVACLQAHQNDACVLSPNPPDNIYTARLPRLWTSFFTPVQYYRRLFGLPPEPAMATPPSTIRAWQYTSTKGGLDKNLKLNDSVPVPRPNPNQHLVKIIATALNPVDYKPAEVQLLHRLLIPNPATPGIDFAGRLITPATGSQLKPGQLVFGAAGKTPYAAGALSEYAAAEKSQTVALPDGIDPVHAAIIPVAGLTAYQSIVPNIKKGDWVFINGGSGGTGVFGIQIAKAVGCHVVTTCSTTNFELCKSLGADEVVDYKKQDIVEALKSSGHLFNLIIDNVGGDLNLYYRCHEYTLPDATYVMVAGLPTFSFLFSMLRMRLMPSFLGGGKRKTTGFFPKPNEADITQLVSWVKSGDIKPVIDSRFAFEDAPKAFEKLKTGRAKGKIVVDVGPA